MLRILLDLDGVLCNWEKSCCRLFDQDIEDVKARWPSGSPYIESALGYDEDEIWRRIDAAGEEWWATLEPYEWANNLYESCCTRAPTYFVTSPSKHPSSLSGKLLWMQQFTGQKNFRNYMIGPKKYLCAKDLQVLIDDNEKNINEFRENGGLGILFPRHCNLGWHWDAVEAPDKYVIQELDEILRITYNYRMPR